MRTKADVSRYQKTQETKSSEATENYQDAEKNLEDILSTSISDIEEKAQQAIREKEEAARLLAEVAKKAEEEALRKAEEARKA